MGRLVATGGFGVSGDVARALHARISAICTEYEFPPGQEFKWSPGKELWMRNHLVREKRRQFFLQVLEAVKDADAVAILVIEDETAFTATPKARDAKEDA